MADGSGLSGAGGDRADEALISLARGNAHDDGSDESEEESEPGEDSTDFPVSELPVAEVSVQILLSLGNDILGSLCTIDVNGDLCAVPGEVVGEGDESREEPGDEEENDGGVEAHELDTMAAGTGNQELEDDSRKDKGEECVDSDEDRRSAVDIMSMETNLSIVSEFLNDVLLLLVRFGKPVDLNCPGNLSPDPGHSHSEPKSGLHGEDAVVFDKESHVYWLRKGWKTARSSRE